jgi:cytochrome c biogenesis protein ResB
MDNKNGQINAHLAIDILCVGTAINEVLRLVKQNIAPFN